MRILLLAFLALLVPPSQAIGADWARSLFSSTSHDFGTVARAAKTEYRFEFENRTKQTLHVRSVRTSCGCTTPIIETESVAPGQMGVILAKFNTHSHTGQRQATVTVTFDQPQFAEVQLSVRGYIRSDIVFSPGEAVFGNVQEGEAKSLTIDLDYAGRSDWKVLSVGSNDHFVDAAISEISRGAGRVKYRIDLQLHPNAPIGPLQSELVIKTSDRNLTTVPLRILANVQASVAVSPQMIALGEASSDEPVRQVLVLRGQQPFKIIRVDSDEFQVNFEPSDESKKLHTITIGISPRPGSGDLQGKVHVFTDLASNPVLSVDANCKRP